MSMQEQIEGMVRDILTTLSIRVRLNSYTSAEKIRFIKNAEEEIKQIKSLYNVVFTPNTDSPLADTIDIEYEDADAMVERVKLTM